MNNFNLKTLLKNALIFIAFLFLGQQFVVGQTTLIAGWDFQTTTNGGTACAAAPSSPSTYVANFGSGNMYLNGTNGSSTWITATSGNEVSAFGGASVNAGTGFSTTTTSPSALALLGGTSNSANGKYIVFKFNMSNYKDLVVSYAVQSTSAAFQSNIWEYSTNGTTWLGSQTIGTISTSFGTKTLTTITGLNNATTAYLRFSGTGATAANGNCRLDNIQLNATSSPATPTLTGTATTSAFTTIFGTASAAQTFTISGSGLTDSLKAIAPTGFEVSKDSSTYKDSVAFVQTSGSASGRLSIRLKATAAIGSYNSVIVTLKSAGATSLFITTPSSGNAVAAPPPTISGAATTSAFSTTYGTASAAQTFSISGSNLTDSLKAKAPTGFEVSKDSTNFKDSISFVQTSGSASGRLSIRLKASATVGSYNLKTISLTSSGATTLFITTPASGDTVLRKSLTITGISVGSKYYDGNTTATISGTPSLVGIVGTDNVTLNSSSVTANFNNANPGSNKAVTISGYTISGTSSSNYSLTQPTGLTSTINKNTQTITFNALTPKTFGAADFALNATASSGLTVTYTSSDESIATISGNTVQIVSSGTVTIYADQSGNTFYDAATTVSQDLLISDFALTPQTISFDSILPVNYGDIDFSPIATAESGNTVTFSSSNTSVATVSVDGTTISIVGAGSTTIIANQFGDGFYDAAPSVSHILIVNPKSITIANATVANKIYNASTAAVISGTLNGVINGDAVSFNGIGTFSSADVNNGISVTAACTLSGAKASNYLLIQPTDLTANITPKSLTIISPSVSNKVYNATTSASLSGTLNGVINSDDVTLVLSANFADANVGNFKTVTSNSTLSGTKASNYSLTQPTGLSANITVAPLAITGFSINNKEYDRTTSATVTGTPALSGLFGSDDVALTGTPVYSFANALVGNLKTVTLTGLTITGLSANNYTLTLPTFAANITKKALSTVNAIANNKDYDGTTAATITATLNGVISPDVVTFNGTGIFASAQVGNSITVTSTSKITGADTSNYTLVQPTGLTANITLPACSSTVATDTVRWNFTAATASPSNAAITNLSVSDLSYGNNFGTLSTAFIATSTASSGYTGASGTNNAGNAVNVSSGLNTQSAAYFQFTLTASQNNSAAITSFSFGTRATSTGPASFSLRSSADNYATDLATFSATANSSWTLKSSSVSSTSNANAVTYRLFGFNGAGNPSSGTINWRIDDIKIGVAITTAPSLNLTSSANPSAICTENTFSYTPTATDANATFSWTRAAVTGISNTATTEDQTSNPNEVLYNTTITPKTVAYAYKVKSSTCYVNKTVSVIVNPKTSSATTISKCSNQLPFVWNGASYSVTGVYTKTLTNQYNCDSTATLNFTVKDTSTSTQDSSVCSSSLPIVWNGISITAQGSYRKTFTNSVSCDSVAKLNVTVTNLPTITTFTYSSATLTKTSTSAIPALVASTNTGSYSYTGTGSLTLNGTTGEINPSTSDEGTYSTQYTIPATGACGVVASNFSVTISKQTQLITFNNLTANALGDADYTLSATASSGLDVTYTSSNPLVATVTESGLVHIIAQGNTNITASQAGNNFYAAATSVVRNLIVNAYVKSDQTITFNSLAHSTYGDASINLSASATSELSVSYSSSNPDVATVAGNVVTILKAGSTVITASQSGNDYFNPAIDVQQTLTIDPKSITMVNSIVSDKIYDRTNTATITATLNGVINNDNVSLQTSGTFASINVANDITVISTSILTGNQAANYNLVQPVGLKANITAKPLTLLSAQAVGKIYDGNTTATITGTLSGILGSDVVTLNGLGVFEAANVGSGISVTSNSALTGALASNYNLIQPTGLVASIYQKELTVTVSINNKEYDKTTSATIASQTLVGVIGNEDVSLSVTPSAFFSTASVGTAKSVTVSAFSLSGTQTSNYILSQPTGLTGNITAKPITINGISANNKIYNGTTTVSITGTPALNGVIPGDTVNVSGSASGAFATAAVGNNKTVNVTGYTVSGVSASNYTVTLPVVISANVYPMPTISEVILPKYAISGNTTASRLQYVCRLQIRGLIPDSTYRYLTAGYLNTSSAGNMVVINNTPQGTDGYITGYTSSKALGGSLMSGNEFVTTSRYGQFTSGKDSTYTGWFSIVPTGNALFNAGNAINFQIDINNGNSGSSTRAATLLTASTITMLNPATGTNGAQAIRGTSFASDENMIFLYDSTNGNGRPLYGTWAENDGITTTSTTWYNPASGTKVEGISGSWGAYIPVALSNGLRRIEQRNVATGNIVGCPATTSNGVWTENSTNVNTVNLTGGTTPLVISSVMAPLINPSTPIITVVNNCNGTSTLSTTATGTLLWSNDQTTSSITVSTSGTYNVTQTVNGCTSLAASQIAVPKNTSTGDTSATACNSFTWYGVNYTNSGNPTKVLTNSVGCDSTVTLHLTIKKSSSSIETISACDSFAWHDNTYFNSNNTATWTGINAAGCDSVVTLNLTINNPSYSIDTVTACDSITWHDLTYYASNNNATWTGTNSHNCDSVVTLYLTITPTSKSVFTENVCGHYTWSINAQTYTTSGNYAVVDGCHTDSLYLTIKDASSSITDLTICPSALPYSWNGLTFTEAGTQTAHLINAANCDSAATLNLSLYDNPTAGITNNTEVTTLTCTNSSISVTATGGVSYSWNNGLGNSADATITAAGTYTVTVTSTNGCTAQSSITITKDISVPGASITNNTGTTTLTCTNPSISVTATGNGTYSWSGDLGTEANASITVPGTYTVTVTGSNGCTSQASVVVNQNISTPTAGITNTSNTTLLTCSVTAINVTATGGVSYVWSDGLGTNANAAITAAGTYTVTVFGANGCSSDTSITITKDISSINAGITNNTGFTSLTCTRTSISVTATGGVSYVWSGGLGNNANATITAAGTYTVTVTGANGCTAQSSITITLFGLPANPVVSATVSTICGSGTSTLSATAAAATTIDWYDVAVGGTRVKAGTAAGSNTYTTPSLTQTTTYYAEGRNLTSGCLSDNRTMVIIVVNPLPVAPTGVPASICGAGTIRLGATPGAGEVIDWYSAATAGTLVRTASSTIDTAITTASKTVFAQSRITATGCLSSTRTAVVGTYNALPATVATVVGATRCTPDTATISATALAGLTIDWYRDTTIAALQSGTTTGVNRFTINTPMSVTTTYYAAARNTTTQCRSAIFKPVVVVVNPRPDAPSATGASRCGSGAVTLSSTPASGTTVAWYAASEGGSSLATTATYSPALTATSTYYVGSVTTATTCASATRTMVIGVVNAQPSAAIATNGVRCGTGTVDLSASAGSDETINWYSAATAGTLLSTGSNTYTTPSIAATTTYFAESNNSNCAAATRTAVVATVNALPATVATVVGATRCTPDTATISATALAGLTIDWYRDTTIAALQSGTVAGVNTFTINTPMSVTTTYYAAARNTTTQCRSAIFKPVVVVVNPRPDAPSATGASRCGSGAVTLSSTPASGTTVAWYAASEGGSSLATTATYSPALTATSTYYVGSVTTATTCASATRTMVIGVVNAQPSAAIATNGVRCGTGTVDLSASAGSGETINWYSAATAGTLLSTGSNTYTTPSIAATTTYFAESNNSNCAAATRTAVVATVNALPATVATVVGATRCTPDTATISATALAGLTIDWYRDTTIAALQSGTTTGVNRFTINTPMSVTTTYYAAARNTTTQCRSAIFKPVVVVVNPRPNAPTAANVARCGNGSVTLSATAPATPAGNTIAWYAAATGGTALVSTATYATSAVSSLTTTYYAEAKTALGCVSTSRTAAVAIVNAIPTAPSVTSDSICAARTTGQSVSLTVSAVGDDNNYIKWYASTTATAALDSINTTLTRSLTATTTYYAADYNPTTGCISSRVTAIAKVLALPTAVTTVVNAAKCGTDTASIKATATAGNTINWYADSLRTGDPISSGSITGVNTYALTTPISATTTYFAAQRVIQNGCLSAASKAVVVVINAVPSAPVARDSARCGTGTVVLTATLPASPAGTVIWYSAATGGSQLGTAATQTTTSITAPGTLTYYVAAVTTATKCTSTVRRAVVATVNEIPALPSTTTPASICGPGVASVVATTSVNGGVIDWYSAATAGTLLRRGSNNLDSSITATKTFYAGTRVTATGCASATRSAVAATVNTLLAASATLTATVTNICPIVGTINTSRFTAASVATATGYVWTIPTTAVIDSPAAPLAANGLRIKVRFTAAGSNDSVYVQPIGAGGCSGAKKVLKLTTTNCVTPVFAKAGTSLQGTMNVKVFPNPSTSNFNLQLLSSDNAQARVKVMDAQGRFIKTMSVNANQTISLGSELKAGTYFIEVRQGKEVKVSKVVKY